MLFLTPARANDIANATGIATCSGYSITVNLNSLAADTAYTIDYSITGLGPTITGVINFISLSSGNSQFFTATATGTFPTLSGTHTPAGTATLTSSGSTQPIVFSPTSINCPTACSTGPQSLAYNVSEQSSNADEIVWFNSHFKLQGTVPTTDFSVNVTDQTITFGTLTLTVPDAVITFSSTATCAITTFTNGTWTTTIPLSYATHADEIFSAGLAYFLPSPFPTSVNNVTWNVTFSSPQAPLLQFQFQYGAANYLTSLTKNGKTYTFPTISAGVPDYNAMTIDPAHNGPNQPPCPNYGGDHAGTPENSTVKMLVTGGGSGGGGSNWTGSWSGSPTYICLPPG